ncbi:MAG: stage V sporulation protein AC [Dethiobacter sp.]
MANNKLKKQTPKQQEYQSFAQKREPKRAILLNCFRAFLVGGIISVVGQFFHWVYITYFGFTETTAGNPTVATMIILATLMTGLGIYDHLAQYAGAGTIIPVTGFANTVASAAIDHRSEGYVLGVGGNMFKIAGPVIIFGVVSAFVVAIIRIKVEWLGGM